MNLGRSTNGKGRIKSPKRPVPVTRILKEFGIHTRSGRTGAGMFWDRPERVHLDTLQAAKKAYRQRIKELRAEHPSGHPDEGALHEAWQRIRKIFKSHGIDDETFTTPRHD